METKEAMERLVDHVIADLMEARESRSPKGDSMESAETGELYGALAKAQGEMDLAKLSAVNPFFKSNYADMASVVKASRGALSKHGLCVIQRLLWDGMLMLKTRLGHSSGQYVESVVPIEPVKKDVQSFGSYITYMKRYAYMAIVGVAGGEEDDDGEAEMHEVRKAEKTESKISKSQLQILATELDGSDDLLEQILNLAKISKLADLPTSRYTGVINWIRDQKK